MIDDRFPELKELAPDEQMALAAELVEEAQKADDFYELSEEAVQILEDELAEVIADPEKGVRWEDLKTKRND